MKEYLPHAEGPVTFDRARHFLQDDRGRIVPEAEELTLWRAQRAGHSVTQS